MCDWGQLVTRQKLSMHRVGCGSKWATQSQSPCVTRPVVAADYPEVSWPVPKLQNLQPTSSTRKSPPRSSQTPCTCTTQVCPPCFRSTPLPTPYHPTPSPAGPYTPGRHPVRSASDHPCAAAGPPDAQRQEPQRPRPEDPPHEPQEESPEGRRGGQHMWQPAAPSCTCGSPSCHPPWYNLQSGQPQASTYHRCHRRHREGWVTRTGFTS